MLHNLCLHEELCLKLIRSRGIILVSDENGNGQFARELNNLIESLLRANLMVGKTVFIAIMSDAKSRDNDYLTQFAQQLDDKLGTETTKVMYVSSSMTRSELMAIAQQWMHA